MFTKGLCTSKCTYMMPLYTHTDKDEVNLNFIDANNEYCVKATLLNFKENTTISSADDLVNNIITNIHDFDYSIYNDILLFNVDTDNIKDFKDTTYKFINYNNYVTNRFINLKNLEIISDDSIKVVNENKECKVNVSGLFYSTNNVIKTSFNVEELRQNFFKLELTSGNHVIRIKHDNDVLIIQISCFLNGKETLIYNNRLKETTSNIDYSIELNKSFKDNVLRIKVKANAEIIFDVEFNYQLINENPLFDNILLVYRINKIYNLQIDADNLIHFPFNKNGIYNYHLFFDYSNILDEKSTYNRNYLYSSYSTKYLLNTVHNCDKESFISTLQYLDKSIEPQDLYFNDGYIKFYENTKDHIKLTTTAFGIYLVQHYNKNIQDNDHIEIEETSDQDIDDYKYPTVKLKNTDNFKNTILLIQGDNLIVDRCYGLKLKLTNVGMRLFNDLFGAGVKGSLSYIGINYTYRLEAIPTTTSVSDDTGISVIPSKIISFLKFDDVELYNYKKNRYIFLKAKINNIIDFLEIENPDSYDYIYLFNIALYLKYNGKIYRLTNFDINVPYKVKIDKELDLLLTISY